jgi:hypothetical protein
MLEHSVALLKLIVEQLLQLDQRRPDACSQKRHTFLLVRLQKQSFE